MNWSVPTKWLPITKSSIIWTFPFRQTSHDARSFNCQSPANFILDHMKGDSTAHAQVEGMTQGQAENPSWNICCKGHLTASNFGPVIRSLVNSRKPLQSLSLKLGQVLSLIHI